MQNFIPYLLNSSLPINETFHQYLTTLVSFFVIVLEFMGLIVIVYTAFKSFAGWIKKDPKTRLNLAEGLAMALNFKLGGEILRTVVVRDMSEILQVGAIILLRAALTFLIHWEIKNEEEDLERHDADGNIRKK